MRKLTLTELKKPGPDGMPPHSYALSIGREDLAEVIESYIKTLEDEALRGEFEERAGKILGGRGHPFFKALLSYFVRTRGGIGGEVELALHFIDKRLAAGKSVDGYSFNDAVNGARKELLRLAVRIKDELRLPSRLWSGDVELLVSQLMVPATFFGLEMSFDFRHGVDFILSTARNKRAAISQLKKFEITDGVDALTKSVRLFATAVGNWDNSTNKTGGLKGRAGDVEPIMELPGGHMLVRLTSAEAMIYEGSKLGHCLGKGAYNHYVKEGSQENSVGQKRTGIYSIRRGDWPRATLEIDGYVKQVKGPANGPVPPDAAEATFEAIKALGFDVSTTDLNQNGYIAPTEWQKKFMTFKSITFGSKTYVHMQSMRLSKKIKASNVSATDIFPLLQHLAEEPDGDRRLPLVTELLSLESLKTEAMASPSPIILTALASGNLGIAKTLLRSTSLKGGPKESKGLYGYGVLHWGVELDDEELIALAVKAGAHLDDPGTFGFSPLHLAAQKGRLSAMRHLLAHGADPLVKSETGATPLHEVLRYGRSDQDALPFVEVLLLAGSDPTHKTEFGHSPVSIAKKQGYEACLLALKSGLK